MPAEGFEDLNDEQRRAVDAHDRAVLVMAPVGTGKTTVLALRAARALAAGVEPRRVLCLSFTNKAAREMQTRLSHVSGRAAGEITARTFHGLCAAILRAEARTLGLDGDFLIYDEEDCTELVSRLVKRHELPSAGNEQEKANFALFDALSKARLAPYESLPGAARRESGAMVTPLSVQPFKPFLRAYMHELRENHALDFTDLIVGVNRLFAEHPAARDAWRAKFGWIQVDEVQDTSHAEYRILRTLAEGHGQLSFFGDVDQTIYGWRGSAPFEILDDYRAQFGPEEIHLVRNYRSTRAILGACSALIRSCPNAVTKKIVPQQADEGDPVRIEAMADPESEAEWIASRIAGLHKGGARYRDCAVLTRNNFAARDISRVFERLGVPHIEVDQQKFFQRAEIKAALAHLRLLVNVHDGNSLMRVFKTPPKGIGEATIEKLRGPAREAGLKITDMLDSRALQAGDPFGGVLDALQRGDVVVFDTETTGTDTSTDEIVEIAAARCDETRVTARFHAFVRPSRPVGESERIHGWSDEFLAANGRDAGEAVEEFRRFASGCFLAGHNVASFDLPMLEGVSRRLGAEDWSAFGVCDTLDVTRRMHRLPRYTLSHIAEALNLTAKPTHQAMDDVLATVELLQRVCGELREHQDLRRGTVAAHEKQFVALARRVEQWRERMTVERPGELLRRVIDESGIADHFAAEKDGRKRLMNLEELCRLFERNDLPHIPPQDALVQMLGVASLGNDVERQASEEDRVAILTVHQAKGLEFDNVFIAHASDDDFPSIRSKREGRYDEEHRLFYVAASRARRRLFITWPRADKYGRRRMPSPFLGMIAGPSAT